MSLKYKVYYSISPGVKHLLPRCEYLVDAINPIRAIDLFHKAMQQTAAWSFDRKTCTRPQLYPNEYQVHKLVQVYPDSPRQLGGTGELIEAEIDLPSSPNPSVAGIEDSRRQETEEMKFDE